MNTIPGQGNSSYTQISALDKILAVLKQIRTEVSIDAIAGNATAANQALEIAELTAINSVTQLANWDNIIGNSKEFTWVAGSLGGQIVSTIEYYTGPTLILTQTFTYDGNDNVTSITAS